jgi:hypothetical protein
MSGAARMADHGTATRAPAAVPPRPAAAGPDARLPLVSPRQLQALQRTAGNRAVGRLLAHARRGGETEPHEDDPLYLGGDGDGGTATAPPASGSGASGGGSAATPAAVTLTYSERTARTRTGCGGYTYAVRWGLNNADATTNGFIVQKLTFDLRRRKCAGGDDNFQKKYWEAWEVRGGQIFVGTSTSRHNADTFQVPSTPDECGVNFEEGKAKFIPNYTAPRSWAGVPEAGSLPATETEPAGWSDAGTLTRNVRVSFDCCDRSDLGEISGDG